MELERLQRAGSVRVEQRDDTQPLTAIGYAAVFYNSADPGTEYDLGYGVIERVMPTAFDRAIGLMQGQAADDVRCLFNHDPNLVLGRSTAGTCRLSKDGTGLLYETSLPNTTIASDLAENLRRGEVTGSSFSFVSRKVVWIEEPNRLVRELHDLELFDVGPVTFPAYESTTAGMRSMPTREKRAESLIAEFETWKRSNGRERRKREMDARLLEIDLTQSR